MMTKISKIKLLTKIALSCCVLVLFMNKAYAGFDTYDCYNKSYNVVYKAQIAPNDDNKTIKLKQSFETLKKELDELCLKADKAKKEWGWTSQKNLEDSMKELGIYETYKNKLKALDDTVNKINSIPASANACGDKYPYGCPNGTVCTRHSTAIEGTMLYSYTCKSPDEKTYWGSSSQVESSQVGSVVMSTGPNMIVQATNADGETNIETFSMLDGYKGLNEFTSTGKDINVRSNAGFCEINEMVNDYMGTCYSCVIVSILISTFMDAVESTYDVCRDAGVMLLAIGSLIWIAFFVLGKISSFVSLEPMKILQELFTFFFKCLLAYVLITSGLKTLVTLIVNPILIAGADYGISVIDAVMPANVNIDGFTDQDRNVYKLSSSAIMEQDVFDKIMTISKKADRAVSLNFVIGESLMCHSVHAGARELDILDIKFYIPDFWIWICGALIWFFAFMVVMGVNFYLLDLSFKIGFAILAMPVVLGLWPFNKFKGKFKECVRIIINAAGTFMFLGITTGMSIILISAAMGGTDELFYAIAHDKKSYIAEKFALTGSSFILILFAFLYSQKLIAKTVSKFADKFFGSSMSDLSPIHSKTTQAIDFVKNKVVQGVQLAGALATGGTSVATKGIAKQATRAALRKVRSKFNSPKKNNGNT